MHCPKCNAPVTGDPPPPFCASCGSPLPREATVDPLIGRQLAGKYKVVQLLGEGGMGSVYLGEQSLGTTIRKVAIKTLHPHLSRDESIKERFSREVGTLAGLEHPNTVGVYDFGTTEDGLLYIAMEFVQGKSLADLIDHGGPIAPDRVQKIVTQIGGSLAEAHSKGIIHRDLKPDNVIITDRAGQKDFVKVLDFGIAQRSGEATKNEKKLTQQGMVLGTPPYMSPEQFTGQALDARSDIYSLGIMAYEMLTGKLPFEAGSAFEWATLHMTSQPKPIEANPNGGALPESMRGAIMKALSKAPDQRFPTMNAFVDAFTGRVQTNAQPAAAPVTPGPPTVKDAPSGRVKTQMGEPLDFGGGMGTPPPGGTAAGAPMAAPPAANAYAPNPYGAPPAPNPYAAASPPMVTAQSSGGGGGMNKGLILGIAGVVLVGSILAIAAGAGAFKGSSPPPPPIDLGTSTATTPVPTTPATPDNTVVTTATTLGGATPPPPHPAPGPKPGPAPGPKPGPAPAPGPGPAPGPAPTPTPTPTPPPPAPHPAPTPTPTPTPPPPAPAPPPAPKTEPAACVSARDAKAKHMPPSLIATFEQQCRLAGGTP
jgi:serine/threonine-protein kinase